jgi:2-polyprenyl-3-methyl-5-hydroxy-6-metoxy-1,4-benzoquinol methylase
MQDFKEIFEKNIWGSKESVSGLGSELKHTQHIIKELNKFFKKIGAISLLDIPCGDANWIKKLDLSGMQYVGIDIVEDLIKACLKSGEMLGHSFRVGNLIEDELPQADVVLCRDCLVHLSLEDGMKAIANVFDSGSEYFVSTTFPRTETNVELTSNWRPINLSIKPYNLGIPLDLINEKYEGDNGIWKDKSLGVWKLN